MAVPYEVYLSTCTPDRLDPSKPHEQPISAKRWRTLPEWVRRAVVNLMRTTRPDKAWEAAGAAVARYEVLALTVKSYSVLDDGTAPTLISNVSSFYFHDYFPSSFLPPAFFPLPLLPLSQEYSLPAFRAAIDALANLVLWQEKFALVDHRTTDGWKRLFGTAREAWVGAWGGSGIDTRRMLSRSVWNAFVRVLEGEPAPPFDQYVLGQVPPPHRGGAHPFPLPDVSHLTQVASHIRDTESAFKLTLDAISSRFLERFHHSAEAQRWVLVFRTGCEGHFEQRKAGQGGGMGVDERRRILIEMRVVLDRVDRWQRRAASPEQLFECLVHTPTFPCPYPLPLPFTPPPPGTVPHLNVTMHSLAHGRPLSAPDAAIGLRTAQRMGTTQEGWAARAAARTAY